MALAELEAIKKHMGAEYDKGLDEARKICSAPGCGVCHIRKALIDGQAETLDPDQQRLAGIMLKMFQETVIELEAAKAQMAMMQMLGGALALPGIAQAGARKVESNHRMGFNPGSDGKRGGSNTSH